MTKEGLHLESHLKHRDSVQCSKLKLHLPTKELLVSIFCLLVFLRDTDSFRLLCATLFFLFSLEKGEREREKGGGLKGEGEREY